MFKVGHQLRVALAGGMLAMQGAACTESNVVLGARGGSRAEAGADAAVHEGAAGSSGPDASAAAGGHSAGAAGRPARPVEHRAQAP